MTRRSLAVLALAAAVIAQDGVPLTQKHFDYNNLPEKADTGTGDRGPQFGVNKCGPATENQESKCQTAMINSIDDFCLWGAPEPNSIVGNTEGESVAWCTKPGRGTRVIPNGALKGVQFIQTPDYVQVTGLINQALINIKTDDSGGEMDPHGADERGNPLGGLLFSNAFPSNGGNKNNFQQVIEWHNFMGGNAFCLKACDPAGPNAAKFCEHVYDRIGCKYNAPAAYAPDVFESCKGENQDFPGHYKDAAGNDVVYQQPPESAGEIQALPYEPRVPATSQCVPYKSAEIYAAAATVTAPASLQTGSTTAKPTTGTSKPATTGKPTGTSTSAPSGAASHTTVSGFAALLAGAVAFVAGL
jgi:hypothetical protein